MGADETPKSFGMIGVFEVGQLVHDHIIKHLQRDKKKLKREGERPARGAAP